MRNQLQSSSLSTSLGQKQEALLSFLPAGTEHSGNHTLMVLTNGVYSWVNELHRHALLL